MLRQSLSRVKVFAEAVVEAEERSLATLNHPEIDTGYFNPINTIDSFCLHRPRLVVKWRHLVVTFCVEEFSSVSQIKYFLLQYSELA